MFPFLVLPSKSSLKSSLLAVLSASALLSAGAMAQGGPLRTGVDATFAPHAMVKLGGGLQGFNIDLGEELARRLGRKIEIEGTEFSGLVPGLNAKKYDFVLAPVTATPERAKAMLSPKATWIPTTPSSSRRALRPSMRWTT
jgi:polar amino acid transport system substrate-binding protein